MNKARRLLEQGARELRARPGFHFALGASHVLFIWTQDLVPIAGPLLSSIAVTLLTARLFTRRLQVKLAPLVGLALLVFPVNVLWTVLLELHRNTTWSQAFSAAWSVPAILFMLLAIATWTLALRRVVLGKTGIDQSLKEAWFTVTRNFAAVLGAALVTTVLCTLAMASGGYGFFLVTPYGYALLKALAEPAAAS